MISVESRCLPEISRIPESTDVVLVDERPPLSLTSDKSTECYRNWWAGPGDDVVALMNRSIDLLEELARESSNGGTTRRPARTASWRSPCPSRARTCSARSGYGLMASSGAAELLADHITGRQLPRYATAFRLARYDDPAYCRELERWGDSGQL